MVLTFTWPFEEGQRPFTASEEPTTLSQSVKRGRGRPKGSKSKKHDTAAVPPAQAVEKRKRGRSPKQKPGSQAYESSPQIQPRSKRMKSDSDEDEAGPSIKKSKRGE
ncbi:hypothetical protein GLOTRDRAFT_131549 [Gloeophyllum trabeum ATCC 11539]|uniref:Uncharacterized protein n=1 Tax=Gloeophyllum trabeum (strain ATCC 11539 / FP-39264 / Madison 617) TaxID=670483 RepID=S7RKT2_GLOTA|nr:uncharacterized protein GLOTRDRAFT_131549 [Gloeophyllum trabeum ATCC 11539]EPQ53279.1 hypothetical protein GLOTRDRAFT_131549 [Gloeophyllum trabeum ATCC 11539]